MVGLNLLTAVVLLSSSAAPGAAPAAEERVVLVERGGDARGLAGTLRRFLRARAVTVRGRVVVDELAPTAIRSLAMQERAIAVLVANVSEMQVAVQLFNPDGEVELDLRYVATASRDLRVPAFHHIKRLHRALEQLRNAAKVPTLESAPIPAPPLQPQRPVVFGKPDRSIEARPPRLVSEASPEAGLEDAALWAPATSADREVKGTISTPEVPAAPASRGGSELRAPLLLLAFGPAGFRRDLTYQGSESRGLAAYKLPLGPKLQADLALFPFARGPSVLCRWGVFGGGEVAFALTSIGPLGERHPTSHDGLRAGAHLGFGLGSVELFARGTFGVQRFTVAGSAAGGTEEPGGEDAAFAQPRLPRALYRTLAAGGGLSLQLSGGASLGVTAGYVAVLSAGELMGPGFFPGARARAVDVGAGLTLRAGESWDVRVSAELRRYAFELNAAPDAELRADAALDLYVSGALLMVYRLE